MALPVPAPLLLFSDVDGTLPGTAPGAAPPRALPRLAAAGVVVVLASSRTLAELVPLRRRLGLAGPLIAENGALVALPDDGGPGRVLVEGSVTMAVAGERWVVVTLAPPLAVLTARVAALPPALQGRWRAAAERADAEVEPAGRGRFHSRLLDLRQDPPLAALLAGHGIAVAPGGRWWQASTGSDKGNAAIRLLAAWTAWGGHRPDTAAIGDDANDLPLLAVVRRPFVIRRPGAGHHPALAALPGAIRLDREGDAGWDEMAERLVPAG